MTYPPVLLTAPRSSGLCTICEDVLINVGESLTRPVTEDTMKSLLNTACGMMPQYLQQTVRSYILVISTRVTLAWMSHKPCNSNKDIIYT